MTMWVWIGLACVLMGTGLVMLRWAQQREHAAHMDERVQKLLEPPTTPVSADAVPVNAVAQRDWWSALPLWLRHGFPKKQLVVIAAAVLVLALLFGAFSRWWVALIIVTMAAAIVSFIAWLKWEKHRKAMARQLPSYIDAMVRMVVLGHATPSAFVMAAGTTKAPLADVVHQAASLAKAGMPVDQALIVASREYKLQEFFLLAAVIQVGTRFGGRVDGLLERVAHYMRDKEEASRELKALSSEVRVSAWVLCLLPVVVGGFIIATNADYFWSMWEDSTGRWITLFGAGLQLLGSVLLYRMASIDE